ncbi:hypothetical protein [Tepidanaerobacter sp. EBM-49]|uniref:hypothetical protein n=1 Tax=Tepidanaerobacter sp. EBM-49 TaxID=1918504 RepID=UPI002579EDFB|nr:hypothetical protein [Tepidanaerobacter sp. EBM-49]
MLHLLAAGTNLDALGENLNISIGFKVLRATCIKINKRFNMLMEQEVIDGPGHGRHQAGSCISCPRKRCENSTKLTTKLTASCREAGCRRRYNGKSYRLG